MSGLDEVREVAILLGGANVYGFLKGEAGLHRRAGERIREDRKEDYRAKDGRSGRRPERGYGPLQLVGVSVDAWEGDADGLLDGMLRLRATGKVEPGVPAALPPSEIVRNYHVEGQRYVRDPRTKVRHNDLNAVLAGDLDEFILAYLRQIEPANVTNHLTGT